MIETPSAAFRQSSSQSRSPETNFTFFPAGNRFNASFKRSKRLEDRTKQRRLLKPYSRRVSTTLAPMKPFDPVTRMQSVRETIYDEVIWIRFHFLQVRPLAITDAAVNCLAADSAERSLRPRSVQIFRGSYATQRMRVSVFGVTRFSGRRIR
jgi:hypothetical protein